MISESRLIPDLKSIQSSVDQVCSSIVAIIQNVVWWGGNNSGTPLYNELKKDVKLKEVLEFLSSCILGLSHITMHVFTYLYKVITIILVVIIA